MTVGAILAALFDRSVTGQGCYLDMSLFDAAVFSTGTRTGFNTVQRSNVHLFPTNDVFDAADGRQIAITIVEQHFWPKFLNVAATMQPDLAAPSFATETDRRTNGDALHGLLVELFATRAAQEWIAMFEGTDVPIEICATPEEAANNPQLLAREAVLRGEAGAKFCPFPVLVDEARKPGRRYIAAPKAGEHSRELLGELGFDDVTIERLIHDGVVAEPISSGS